MATHHTVTLTVGDGLGDPSEGRLAFAALVGFDGSGYVETTGTCDEGTVFPPAIGNRTDLEGVATFDLVDNSEITPANTYWMISTGAEAWVVDVQSSGDVDDLLVDTPADFDPSALAAHIADPEAHGGVGGGTTDNPSFTGDVTLVDGSMVLPAVNNEGVRIAGQTNPSLKVREDSPGVFSLILQLDDGSAAISLDPSNDSAFLFGAIVAIQSTGLLNMFATAGIDFNGSDLLNPSDPSAGNEIGDRDYNDARYQALDSDLTSIAALTTTSYGRSLLTQADAAAARAVIDLDVSGKGFVNHGSTASTARPSGYASVEWYGTVEPDNWIDGDTWNDPT
jgi:hypothetical protein